MTDDLATIAAQENRNALDAWYADSDQVEGYDLIKKNALFAVVGVPFKITRMTFRPGTQDKAMPWQNDYVSAEFQVAPYAVIMSDLDRIISRRSSLKEQDQAFIPDPRNFARPGEFLVINDGSTGFYRQALVYLEAKKLISLPDNFPVDGEKNACRYDLPHTEWLTGGDAEVPEFEIKLNLPRGLRFSTYENPVNKSERAITWYMA